MNWKLIFRLSLFGLVMAIATISWIPVNIEPVCWLIIFIVCAWIIAKRCSGRYFLHGFLVSLVNCVWITSAHILFYARYIAAHPQMASMNARMPLATHPRLMMGITGPLIGILSGLVLGLFAWIASLLVRNRRQAAG